MSWRTQYSKFEKPYTAPGERVRREFQLRIDDDGEQYLAVVGSYDQQDYINSFKDSVDVNLIVDRFARGEATLADLNRKQGFYADVSEMPSSLIEAYNKIESAKKLFDTLPREKREAYGNDYLKFMADFGNEKFFDALGFKPKDKEVIKEEEKEVKENE